MRTRRRRGVLGLRGRIVGAVLFTSLATLAVAALTLLGPLESKLKNAELRTLQGEVGSTKQSPAKTAAFAALNPGYIIYHTLAPSQVSTVQPDSGGASAGPGKGSAESRKRAAQAKAEAQDEQKLYAIGHKTYNQLVSLEESLQASTGAAEVALLGYFNQSGHDATPISVTPDPDIAHGDVRDDAAAAYRSRRAKYTFGSIYGTEYARAALPFTTTSKANPLDPDSGPVRERWVLVVRKPLDEVTDAVATVRTAFLYAALAGLALTLILGIPLSATIVRRLRRLRQAATELAHDGPPVEVPAVRTRDEVGDLARSFEQMQQRLQQQEEARRAFVSTASHELRTPLASLDGMLELLDDDLGSGQPDLDDARLLLERARSQSRRLSRLAADLLDLSRLDAQIQLRSEPVELGELSRAVLAEFELGTEARGIVSTLDDSPGQVWARGDPGSIARIVRILLDNAVRVSPQGGEVSIALRNGDYATLSVRDEGPGVPEEEHELIFQRFHRGRAASGSAGFGLGLAIGRELASRMGGELVLERSDAPGAKFTLRLPVAHAQEEEPLAVV